MVGFHWFAASKRSCNSFSDLFYGIKISLIYLEDGWKTILMDERSYHYMIWERKRFLPTIEFISHFLLTSIFFFSFPHKYIRQFQFVDSISYGDLKRYDFTGYTIQWCSFFIVAFSGHWASITFPFGYFLFLNYSLIDKLTILLHDMESIRRRIPPIFRHSLE